MPFGILSLLSMGSAQDVLTQEMLMQKGDTFVIRKNYILQDKVLTLPEGKTLIFDGGSIDRGEIVGNHSDIQVNQTKPAFGLNIKISGVWNVAEVHDGWFSFDPSSEFVSNQVINNLLAFSNDSTPCHIILEEDRTYYFELPYKGRANLGAVVSTKTVNGNVRRNYSDLLKEEFSYLRIFTIPSNTHLTVNNKLKMLPTSVGAYFVFWEYGKENITVDGRGTIAGDNDWHRYDKPFTGKNFYGEWGHIFRCIRCSNFVFKDITISDAFGDCVINSGSISLEETESRWSSGMVMENVKVLRARRNGVALGMRDVVIRNCVFEDCGSQAVKGTKPMSAIDFEPDGLADFPEIGNENVMVENCSFKNNYYDIASYYNNKVAYGKVAVTVRNCKFTAPIDIHDTRWIRFENCYFPLMGTGAGNNSRMLRATHLDFINCEFGVIDQEVVKSAKRNHNTFTNCKFNTAKKN